MDLASEMPQHTSARRSSPAENAGTRFGGGGQDSLSAVIASRGQSSQNCPGVAWDSLTFHPIAEIFPMIEGPEFDALVADVREHGLREPIVTFEGAILDGRNRFRACQAAGIPYRLEPFRGDDAASFVVSLNLRRRHMDASQRATWMAVNALPEISYADAHAYPTQYGNLHTFASLDRYIDDHIQLAHHVLHKPFIWGEFAFNTQARRHRGRPSLAWFDRFLARTLFDDADGALVWIYATARARLRPHAIDIDGDEHEGAFVRARMQQLARDADQTRDVNTSLNDSLGDASLWLAPTVFRGPLAERPIAAQRFAPRWQFGPDRIYEIQGQGAGFWQALPSPHIYVSGAGVMTFRLSSPPAMHVPAGSIVRLYARASSELPGRGLGAEPDDASRIRVEIDGLLLGDVDVIPDDGVGAEVMLESTSQALLERLQRPGRHTLRFLVLGDERANGLCLYGALRAPSITLSIEPSIAPSIAP